MVKYDSNSSFPLTEEKVFGRKKSKRLSHKQKDNFHHYLAKYSIFKYNEEGSFDLKQIHLKSLFDKVTDFELEIGFGMGDFLFQKALCQPNIGFLGCEVFENGIANLVTRIKEKDLKNIFLHPGNCISLLDNLQGAQLKTIYILFPDPWPKQKHRKRRFLTTENIDKMLLTLKIGGCIYVVTDIGEYSEEISLSMNKRSDVKARSVLVEDFKAPLGNQFKTKFERKADAQDRVPKYMIFERIV